MYGIDIEKQTKRDLIFLAGAYLFVFASLALAFWLREAHFFARSGSIMVLLAVMIEYANFGIQQSIYSKATEGSGTLNGGVGPVIQPQCRQLLMKFTHCTVIFGTFIWGYGDLFLPFKT